MPSVNSVSLVNLTRLHAITADPLWMERAAEQAAAFFGTVQNQPSAYTFFLTGLSVILSRENLS
jgi:uncharacterized protein YyaL (SSP411 family)